MVIRPRNQVSAYVYEPCLVLIPTVCFLVVAITLTPTAWEHCRDEDAMQTFTVVRTANLVAEAVPSGNHDCSWLSSLGDVVADYGRFFAHAGILTAFAALMVLLQAISGAHASGFCFCLMRYRLHVVIDVCFRSFNGEQRSSRLVAANLGAAHTRN